jgi:CubicO group peptidase (beta-lactamase class C family)
MQRPYWPTADWRTAHPSVLKMDTQKLTALDELIRTEYENICGIVVVKEGFIAYEKYFNGYGPNDTLHVASVTKSIVSALIGIAIDKNYIKSADEKVLSFFPEYASGAAAGQKQDITLRHLLTMTAPYAFEDWHEPFEAMCAAADWAAYILAILGRSGHIGTFKYSSAGAHLLSAVLTRTTGQSAREFANEHLFAPIGMRQIANHEMKGYGFDDLFGRNVQGWVSDPAGNSTGGWGLTLSARDMARFGFLYLNNGMWEDRQIISKKWIDESTAANANHYGYLWWLYEEAGLNAALALGDGGNVICFTEQKDLVIAIVSHFSANARDRWALIWQHILPAVIE